MESKGTTRLIRAVWQKSKARPDLAGWLRVGVIAAASGLAGGLAAAWYYRRILNSFREAEAHKADSTAFVPDDETQNET